MKSAEIHAVELVRRIRDEHYEILKGRTPEEQLAFYREKAKDVLERAEERRAGKKKSA